ncbi:MAG: nuclear transport factor 2 family protein [Cycloclasticus sp.]|nr:nuclear transport factor 2 family protein [Cycloclasticus sp.]
MKENEFLIRIGKLENDFQRLNDINEIRNLKAEQVLAFEDAENSVSRSIATVTEDTVMDYGPDFGVHEGIDVFRQFAEMPPFKWAIHFMVPSKIKVHGDGQTAEAIWYLWELATKISPIDGKEKAVLLAGVYYDSYRKLASGEWKISKMKFDSKLLCSYKKGWKKEKIINLSTDKWAIGL